MVQVILKLPQSLAIRLDDMAGGPQKRSRFVRLLLERRMGAHPPAEHGHASVQVNLRFRAKEFARLQRAATAAGMTRPEWILALIRRHHFAKPQFARADRIALMEAHRELHRIGALLREFASSRLTAGAPASSSEVDVQILAAVAEIEHQLCGLRCGIEGNFEYWSADS